MANWFFFSRSNSVVVSILRIAYSILSNTTLIVFSYVFSLLFSYVINTNIKGTDVAIFAILDGHGGEFAAVFAKDRLMDKLTRKIEEAINIALGKVSPRPQRKILGQNNDSENEQDDNNDEKIDEIPKLSRTGSQRRSKLKKALSTDDDCSPPKVNCNQEQDSFLSKLSSIRITKESFLKTNNKVVKPTDHDASHYVDRNRKINFGKMVTDLVLLTDYELVEKAKKQVSWYFDKLFIAFIN